MCSRGDRGDVYGPVNTAKVMSSQPGIGFSSGEKRKNILICTDPAC